MARAIFNHIRTVRVRLSSFSCNNCSRELTDSNFLKPRTWKHFIPESNKHTFARGGYYSVEAIPETLLLVSLNTLYFYENNKIVEYVALFLLSPLVWSDVLVCVHSGCPDDTEDMSIYSTTDPGTEHLQWLEQQLLLARSAGMQVWLTGHGTFPFSFCVFVLGAKLKLKT